MRLLRRSATKAFSDASGHTGKEKKPGWGASTPTHRFSRAKDRDALYKNLCSSLCGGFKRLDRSLTVVDLVNNIVRRHAVDSAAHTLRGS